MLLNLLRNNSPSNLKLLLIDPKMLELSVYDDIPHLITPVITDMQKAANGLNWCVKEMDKRYKLMSILGVRSLEGYNQKASKTILHTSRTKGIITWKSSTVILNHCLIL